MKRESMSPWYMNPVTTCKVLNRIASRHEYAPLLDLNDLLDQAIEKLWSKQENYYTKVESRSLAA